MRPLHRRIRSRFGAGAVAVVAAASVVTVAGAAHAREGGADLAVSIPATTVVREAGKPFGIILRNNGPEAATGVRLTIDTGKLDTGKLEVGLPGQSDGCTVESPTRVVCPVPDLPPGGTYHGLNPNRPEAVVVRPTGGSGAAGTFTASVEAPGLPDPDPANNTATTSVNVATSGIDMTAWAQDVYAEPNGAEPIRPGQTGKLLWLLWNFGNKPIKGVEYTITLPPYLTFDSHRPGCSYESGDTVAHCRAPDVLIESGEWFIETTDGQFDPTVVRLAANAPGPAAIAGGIVTGHGLAEVDPAQAAAMRANGSSPRAGVLSAAEAAKLKGAVKSRDTSPGSGDADPADNTAPFSVFTGDNPADLSITATPVSGHVGDTVNLKLTVGNAGPADALRTTVRVSAPAGTEFVAVDAVCTATTAGKEYACGLGVLPKGESAGSDAFKVKILSATVADGRAEVSSAVNDPRPGDNAAPIKVTVGDPASPSTGPSAPPAGGTGGGLPITGAQAGLTSAFGFGLAAVGALLMVLARRRRAFNVPPTD